MFRFTLNIRMYFLAIAVVAFMGLIGCSEDSVTPKENHPPELPAAIAPDSVVVNLINVYTDRSISNYERLLDTNFLSVISLEAKYVWSRCGVVIEEDHFDRTADIEIHRRLFAEEAGLYCNRQIDPIVEIECWEIERLTEWTPISQDDTTFAGQEGMRASYRLNMDFTESDTAHWSANQIIEFLVKSYQDNGETRWKLLGTRHSGSGLLKDDKSTSTTLSMVKLLYRT